jgi:hypothetical protein
MRLAELQQALRAADPAAVLVAPRVLDRVIRHAHDLPTLLWTVPHQKSIVVDRQVLFQHVEQDDLLTGPGDLLPTTVILLAWPAVEELNDSERGPLLLKYWSRLFHAGVHLALETRGAEGKLTPEQIRDRVEAIGRAEFEEIRLVLDQENYLLPPADDRAVYVEFAAVYLQLRYFGSDLLPSYFPGIRDTRKIDDLLGQDLDARELFTRTRLVGAPEPEVRDPSGSDEAHEYYWKLVHNAERAAAAGNTVRAAIQRTRAARVAPADLAPGTRAESIADLQQLTQRLQAALELTDAEAAEWLKDLPALLDKADQGSRPVEAALLYDLQKVCLDHEREIYTLDLVEWLLSAGKRPIKRPLPSQRLVQVTRHLRSAAQRLTAARLSTSARRHLARLLQEALHRSEERLRSRFRPVLADAFLDVGLRPENVPERTASSKMVEEILDRITEYGFLTFSELRDVISRNQLKLPDVKDPQQFIRGDPLLRLDRRLATQLDGVYRRGDFYLRWLERFTSLNFGTKLGRWITRYLTLPFGGALAMVEGLQFLLTLCGLDLPLFGPLSALLPLPSEKQEQQLPVVGILSFFFVGFFLLALMHRPAFRARCARIARSVGRGLRTVIIEVPALLVKNPALRRLVSSWTFQLFYGYLFKPLVICGLLYLVIPRAFGNIPGALTTFAVVVVLVNSRPGKAVGEALVLGLVQLDALLRAGLIPGLVRLVMALFKWIIHLVESVLFTVDEWLRFRSGESRFSMTVRAILGVFWWPVSFLARFYMVVLIEPGFNPIKAPLSILFAKFLVPFVPTLTAFALGTLEPVLGKFLAYAIGGTTIWLLPDAFTFLFWEIKENWSLYRANRGPRLKPAVIGHHGETVRNLLQPGFHSGTVPKLYARLRRAERAAHQSGNWSAARAYRSSLENVGEAVRRFVSREFVSLLRQARSCQGLSVEVGRVSLAPNRIAVELTQEGLPSQPLWVEFETRAGWLVACLSGAGWVGGLTEDQLRAFTLALASLYQLAGIELVHEQVRAALPAAFVGYDLIEEGLLLWLDQRHGKSVIYPLLDQDGELRPRTPQGTIDSEWPALDGRRVLFARVAISWQQLVEGWQAERDGKGLAGPFAPDADLVLVDRKTLCREESLPPAVPMTPGTDGPP